MGENTAGIKRTLTQILIILVLFVMYVQIVMGIIWIVKNLSVIPPFGDSNEYLELSETFAPDEYRPILFPVILRLVQNAATKINIPYQTLLYTVQLIVSFFSIFSAVSYISRSAGYTPGIMLRLVITAYIWTLPMILWFNCTVLTDSFALSSLIWMIIGLTKYVKDGENSSLLWIGIIITYLIQALMRSDRTYSALIMIFLCILVRSVHDLIGKIRSGHEQELRDTTDDVYRKREYGRKMPGFLMPLILTVVSVVIVIGVNHVTQKPGSKGRVTTNLSFILLDRVVWPNMERNYEYFPEEIRETISLEEARKFDSHNNNVMYQMAPLVEERVGKEKASEYYMSMAKIVWEHDRNKVIKDTAGTVAVFIMLPQSEFLNRHKMINMNTGWNINCMTKGDEALTRFMFTYYMYSFCLIFCSLSIIFFIISGRYRRSAGRLSCFICMSVLLALWFGLGDGAPVNDRYGLIVLVTWGLMWMLVILRLFPERRRRKSTY